MNHSKAPRIYLALAGEKKLAPQLSHLLDCLDLLPEETSAQKKWRRMLASPYFVQDARVAKLAKYLQAAHDDQRDFLKGQILLKKLFGRVNYQQDRKVLLALLRELETLIWRFCRDHFLAENPLERLQLEVEIARNSTQDRLFKDLLRKWQKQIDKQPSGTKRMLHQWRHYHHGIVNTQGHKQQQGKLRELVRAKQSLQHLTQLVTLIYDHDLLSLRRMYQFSTEDTPTNTHDPILLSLYKKLLDLRTMDSFSLANYRATQAAVMQYGPTFSTEQHHILWQLIFNYLSINYRKGRLYLRREMLFWLHYQMHHKLFHDFKSLRTSIVINHVGTALLNQDVPLAREIKEQLSPYFTLLEQQQLEDHIDIALAFHTHQHDRVIELIKTHFPRQKMNVYVDALRLKSYQIRSLLCLMTVDPFEYASAFQQAEQDFKTYLDRQNQKLSEKKHQFFAEFLAYIHQLYLAIKQARLFEQQIILIQELEEKVSIHCKDWMMAFLCNAQFSNKQQLQPHLQIEPQLLACASIRAPDPQ